MRFTLSWLLLVTNALSINCYANTEPVLDRYAREETPPTPAPAAEAPAGGPSLDRLKALQEKLKAAMVEKQQAQPEAQPPAAPAAPPADENDSKANALVAELAAPKAEEAEAPKEEKKKKKKKKPVVEEEEEEEAAPAPKHNKQPQRVGGLGGLLGGLLG